MEYKAIVKTLPSCTVFYSRKTIKGFENLTGFILSVGEECTKANPDLKCLEPDYCFVSYLDKEFKTEDVAVEYAEAVEKPGNETENVKFKKLPEISAVCVLHKGSYEKLGDAYAFAVNFAKENGYSVVERARERYIDGMWNKESEEDWLTEVEIPVIKSLDEVREKWGATPQFEESEKKAHRRTAGEEFAGIAEAEDIFREFSAIKDTDPAGKSAMELVEKWRSCISENYYQCSKEVLSCLGQMYSCDSRFTENIDRFGAGTAKFMSDAISEYCKK